MASQLVANIRAVLCTDPDGTLRMDRAERLRLAQVLPHVRGTLLDLGCGYNNLVRRYGRGVGVDVHPWAGIDVLLDDSSRLPFPHNAFDTVAIIATLNHIPNREAALCEVRRVLKDDGRLILTMIGPTVGFWAHIIFRQDEQRRGGMEKGELKGMTDSHVTTLLHTAGFEVVLRRGFEFGLNHLYVAHRRG